MIKINYFEYTHYFTDIILGHILLEGITETITPLFKLDSRKKHFKNEDYRATLCRNEIKLLDRGLLSSISKNKLYIDIEQLKLKPII